MFCNNCGSFQDSCLQRVIDIAPPVLIIVLDRGLGNRDFKEDFLYDEYLNLSNFVFNSPITQYYLCGVIAHFGESGPLGHFMAFCKMDINSPWYLYNDSSVNQCTTIHDVFHSGIPYILFYHCWNN